MEITVAVPNPNRAIEVEAVVLHRWVDDRLFEYRVYVDPLLEIAPD